MTFKTARFPSVAYQQPSEYAPDSIVLNAMVNPNGGGATTFHYEYGLTAAYGSSTPESASIGSDSSEHLASAKVTGLEPGTTYRYRIVVTAPGGAYVSPEDQVFTTLPVAPTIGDSSVSERSPSAATIDTDVKPGFGATVVFFRYGPSAQYNAATVPGPALAADDEAHPVNVRLEGLTPDTLYHYQVVAINFNGSSTSVDRTFETGGTPRISDENATGVTDTTAQISAEVNPNLAVTSFHIEYGTSSAFGSSTAESATIGADESSHAVSQTLTGLSPSTIYHYRVVGTNAIATGLGEEETFSTAPAKKTEPPPPPKCKKGFVRKNGKCVKKPRKPKKKHHRHGGGGK
jgi:phosphodiesterase/alkaline phosphatase D-like protein